MIKLVKLFQAKADLCLEKAAEFRRQALLLNIGSPEWTDLVREGAENNGELRAWQKAADLARKEFLK